MRLKFWLLRAQPTFRRHFLPILGLILYGALCNVVGLGDFAPQLAWWHDDNIAYYAERAVSLQNYPGDIWHNSFQAEYAWLSSPTWISALLYWYFDFSPVTAALIFTALKVWLLSGACYLLANHLSGKPLAALVAAIGVNSSYIIWWNLASFAYVRYMPYQSDLAYPFVLLSIYALSKNRIFLASLALVVAVSIQPAIGLYGVFFLVLVMLLDFRQFSRQQFVILIASLILITLVALIPARLVLTQIPVDQLGSARTIYEALNVTHGGLWECSWCTWWTRLLGLVMLSLFLVPAMVAQLFQNRMDKILRLVLFAAILLTGLGVIVKGLGAMLLDSVYLAYLIPFHQLLMTRASAFFLIIAFLYITLYLIIRLGDGRISTRLAALLALIILVDMNTNGVGTNDPGALLFVNIGLVLVLLINEVKTKRGLISGSSFRIGKLPFSVNSDLIVTALLITVFAILCNRLGGNVLVWSSLKNISLGFLVLSTVFLLHSSISKLVSFALQPMLVYAVNFMSALSLVVVLVYNLSHSQSILQAPAHVAVLIIWPFLPLLAGVGAARKLPFVRLELLLRSLPITVVLFLAVTVSIQDALSMRLPKHHVIRDWYATTIWAREHTVEQSSFLFLTDYSEYNPGGWRTFAHRGRIKLFSYPVSLVYTPDLRFQKYTEPIFDYWQNKYPTEFSGQRYADILQHLDEVDLEWLKNYTGAAYAVASKSLRLSRPLLFVNESFVIYGLNNTNDIRDGCEDLTDWLQHNTTTAQTLITTEAVCLPPPFITDFQVMNQQLNLETLLGSMPDLLIVSDYYIDKYSGENRPAEMNQMSEIEQEAFEQTRQFYSLLKDEDEFLNYRRVKVFEAPEGWYWKRLNVYQRFGPRSLKGLVREATGSSLFPSPHGLDILEFDGGRLPTDMYLATYEGAVRPYTLDIQLVKSIQLKGIGFVWWSAADHPVAGTIQGWHGQEKVFEYDLPVEKTQTLAYSWLTLQETATMDRLVLLISEFEGQQRLLLRRLFAATSALPE